MLRHSLTTAITVAAVVAIPGVATSASDNARDVKSLAPGPGVRVAHGSTLTFRVRISHNGNPIGGTPSNRTYQVFVRVASSPKLGSNGLIGDFGTRVYIDQMQQVQTGNGDVFQATVKKYAYPSYWLNHPRSKPYYWQAYFLYCAGDKTSCWHIGKTRRLYVR